MVVLGWVIYWFKWITRLKNAGHFSEFHKVQWLHQAQHANGPRSSRSELHITAAHSSSFGKSGPFFLGLFFFRQSLRFLGGLRLGPSFFFVDRVQMIVGATNQERQAYLQWCSCYEILWIYFHCTSYNKSSKALDEGLRFAQSHQSSVTYVPREFMVGSCPASGKTIIPWKKIVWRCLKMKSL